ncbi:MAG: DUF882 domain-containing protein [Kofleriaceae bacterium]
MRRAAAGDGVAARVRRVRAALLAAAALGLVGSVAEAQPAGGGRAPAAPPDVGAAPAPAPPPNVGAAPAPAPAPAPKLGPTPAPILSAMPARVDPTPPGRLGDAGPRTAKKDLELADKRARAAAGPSRPVTRVGAKPAPLVNLFHRWTQESLAVPLAGPLPPDELQRRLLRDHYTNETTEISPKLIPTLLAAAKTFNVARVEIVSAYRHPKYNLILRKKGHQVARDSEHSHGQAVDFRLPGVTTERLSRWAIGRRAGGVGTYLQSGFVHVDAGRVRRWSGE